MAESKLSSALAAEVSRRRLLLAAWAATAAALAGQSGWALWEFLRPRARGGAFGSVVDAGVLEEFAPGSVSRVRLGRFYVSALDGGLLAMWWRCTHLGCTVPWVPEEGRFHCPCHGSIFNERGEVLAGPAPRPLDLFPVRIAGGRVLVDTGRPIERAAFDPAQLTRG